MSNNVTHFVLPADHQELRYYSEENNFFIKAEQIDKFILKITVGGLLKTCQIEASDKVFQRLLIFWKETGKPELYGIADLRQVQGIEMKARKSLQKLLIEYFKAGLFQHLAIFGMNYLSLTLGIQLIRFQKEIKLSFHKNESQALHFLQKKLPEPKSEDKDQTLEQIRNTPFSENWKERDHILVNGTRLSLENRKVWNVTEFPDIQILGFLIDKRIIFIKAEGNLTREGVAAQSKVVFKILEATDQQETTHLIMDYSGLKPVKFGARKELEKREKDFRKYWSSMELILNGINKSLFNIYKTISRNYHYINLSADMHDAIRKIMWTNPEQTELLTEKTDENELFENLSKKELIRIAQNLQAENNAIKANQKNRLEELFDVISRITWDESFKPRNLQLQDESDPFYLLYQGIGMLQSDVFELISELKSLNKELENKVNIRTREIQEKEANLTSLIENTTEMICSVDRHYNILIVNTAYKEYINEFLGQELKPGTNLLQYFTREMIEYWQPFFDRVLKGEFFQVSETRLHQGNKVHYRITFNPIENDEQQINGFSFFIKDTTADKVSEIRLLESEQMISSINQNIQEGLYRSNEYRQLFYVNNAFVKMFGYDKMEEVMDIPFSDLYFDPLKRLELVRDIKKNNRIVNREIKFRRKDGSTFWGLITSIRTVDEKGQEIYDGAIRDITKFKQFEDKLIRQNRELKKVNNELDRFVYSASHDLRAPLMSILGLINVARIDPSREELENCLSYMERSIRKLDSFIMDIIKLSRNSRQELTRDKIDFEQMINNIFFDLRYHKKNVNIDKIVEVDQPAEFIGDVRRIHTILNNVISNSIIYKSNIREQSFIKVKVAIRSKKAIITVEDNGEGISAQHIDKVFNMFYRASEEFAGSGLGLYIVKETITKLNGKVSLKSEVGVGTSIYLEIPELS
jgi:PAS domain S-box-containing protein